MVVVAGGSTGLNLRLRGGIRLPAEIRFDSAQSAQGSIRLEWGESGWSARAGWNLERKG